jgi:hypothetical protein
VVADSGTKYFQSFSLFDVKLLSFLGAYNKPCFRYHEVEPCPLPGAVIGTKEFKQIVETMKEARCVLSLFRSLLQQETIGFFNIILTGT